MGRKKTKPLPWVVKCEMEKLVPVEELDPHPRNPNTHSAEQVAALVKIIAATGWRAPIVVSHQTGFVTKGHLRRLAALAGSQECAPVDFQDYDGEAEELADMVADNRVAELAVLDVPALQSILGELPDTELAGFTAAQVADLGLPPDASAPGGNADPKGGEAGTKGKKTIVSVGKMFGEVPIEDGQELCRRIRARWGTVGGDTAAIQSFCGWALSVGLRPGD